MIETFNWVRVSPPMGDFARCLRRGLTLHAFPDGAWKVIAGTEAIAHWEEQASGKDINEAMRRAQAAAIVQHSLRGNTIER